MEPKAWRHLEQHSPMRMPGCSGSMSASTWAWEIRLQPCLVKTTDITAGMQPLLMTKWVAPGGVCTAVGAGGWGRREEGGVHGEGCRGAAEQPNPRTRAWQWVRAAQEGGPKLEGHLPLAPSQ
jgi:hypothetical protein